MSAVAVGTSVAETATTLAVCTICPASLIVHGGPAYGDMLIRANEHDSLTHAA